MIRNDDDVLTTSSARNKVCCSVLYSLKTPEQIVNDAKQQRVTVVKTRKDEGMHVHVFAALCEVRPVVSIHPPTDRHTNSAGVCRRDQRHNRMMMSLTITLSTCCLLLCVHCQTK